MSTLITPERETARDCPCCDSENVSLYKRHYNDRPDLYMVQCDDCGEWGTTAKTAIEAVKNWNGEDDDE